MANSRVMSQQLFGPSVVPISFGRQYSSDCLSSFGRVVSSCCWLMACSRVWSPQLFGASVVPILAEFQ